MRVFLFLLFLFLIHFAHSQAIITDTLHFSSDTVRLKHSFLVPFSEKIYTAEKILSKEKYSLNYQKGWLVWTDTSLKNKTYLIQYRCFASPPKNEIFSNKFVIKTDSSGKKVTKVENEKLKGWDELLDLQESKLNKTGNISRGISVGNNQSLAVNSGLQLQIEGDLGDGISILGSINDDNIPIQPNGNTQQLSDFDKVFIQLKKDKWGITIGDYEIVQRNTRFADVYRNVQGLKGTYSNQFMKSYVSGAVAKGKFHSNTLQGKDGVVGPYRLIGKSGETFFTVLAGSEKVYLNGQLLIRGENNDYIIDYNTGQITFTAKNVITNISRIVVDFEYSDRFYNRSLLFSGTEANFWNKKLQVKFSYGRDGDNPNAPIDNQETYNAYKATLAGFGDADLAYTSGVDSTKYSALEARYLRQDTVVNGIPYTFYKRSNDSLVAIYKIFFSYRGEGKGYYVRETSGINQNAFVWSPPNVLGQPTGDYDTLRAWVLPKRLQVADMQVSYQLTPKLQVFSETALSYEDKNLLSAQDDADNTDLANLVGLRWNEVKIKDSTLKLTSELQHTYIGARYNNIDRLYKAEYGRMWNFNDLTSARKNEHTVVLKNQLNLKKIAKLTTETGFRQNGNGRNALRQVYGIHSFAKKMLQGNLHYTHILAKEDSIARNSLWQRLEGEVFYPLKSWKIGSDIWLENKNERINTLQNDQNFQFIDLKPYFRTVGEDKKWTFDVSFNYRYDRAFFEEKYREKSRATTQYYKMMYQHPKRLVQFQNITSIRNLYVLDTFFLKTGINTNRTINENLQLDVHLPKGWLDIKGVYDIASEQIARRDVRFIQVNNGQGEYEWQDLNGNEIQEFNEFIISNNPLQANFIRVVIPTIRLYPTTKAAADLSIKMELSKIMKTQKKKTMEILRNMRTFSNLKVYQNKQRDNSISSYLVRLNFPEDDSSLIDAGFTFRQELTFFQNAKKGNVKFAFQQAENRLFLLTGTDSRFHRYLTASQQLNLGQSKSISVETYLGRKRFFSQSFTNRNYNIPYFQIRPLLNWQVNKKIGLSSSYDMKYKRNFNDSMLQTTRIWLHKFTVDGKIRFNTDNYLNPKIDFISISEKGTSSFAADYELKEGLRTGFNLIWTVNWNQKITKDLQMMFTYEGRAMPQTTVIHTGRVQVQALF
ncbi:MAG: hypothetical protein ACKVTZ_10535 [Bacteroidia bacterium]